MFAAQGKKRVTPNALRENSHRARQARRQAAIGTRLHWPLAHSTGTLSGGLTSSQGLLSLSERRSAPTRLGKLGLVIPVGSEVTTRLSPGSYLSHHALEQPPHQLHHALQGKESSLVNLRIAKRSPDSGPAGR